ncbi:MAG: hypothetical protein K2K91_05540 [Ruminococcus sp.]|nr:hypothetical protein [Ruminococcus sp.]MDE7099107.1 hypothetical protein [Ruminococcus sp.]
MALFKKKNQEEAVANTASEEKGFDYKEAILKALNEKLKGTLYDGCIIMPRGFTVDVRIGRTEDKENVKLLQAIFIVEHDDFDEPLIEPVDAQGETYEDAAKMAADIFYGGVWHPLDQSMFKKNPFHITSTYLNQHYEYDMYAQSIVRIGTQPDEKPVMLINGIINQIPKYLGSKKYYWVRIYLAKHKENEIIEVRVNGSVCNELARPYKEYIDTWNASERFLCEKQYAIFVQREDDKCPFKKEAVMKTAKAALEKMCNTNNREEYLKMAEELDEIAGNKDIAAEVRIFIPEILAKLTLGYQEGDSLFLLEGDSRIEFKKTQLRSYFYIQQAVLEFLNTRPPQADVQKIVMNSVAFRELRKVNQEQGHEPKDLFVPGTAYKISSENYKVW